MQRRATPVQRHFSGEWHVHTPGRVAGHFRRFAGCARGLFETRGFHVGMALPRRPPEPRRTVAEAVGLVAVVDPPLASASRL